MSRPEFEAGTFKSSGSVAAAVFKKPNNGIVLLHDQLYHDDNYKRDHNSADYV